VAVGQNFPLSGSKPGDNGRASGPGLPAVPGDAVRSRRRHKMAAPLPTTLWWELGGLTSAS
jgi:hypothetical protein